MRVSIWRYCPAFAAAEDRRTVRMMPASAGSLIRKSPSSPEVKTYRGSVLEILPPLTRAPSCEQRSRNPSRAASTTRKGDKRQEEHTDNRRDQQHHQQRDENEGDDESEERGAPRRAHHLVESPRVRREIEAGEEEREPQEQVAEEMPAKSELLCGELCPQHAQERDLEIRDLGHRPADSRAAARIRHPAPEGHHVPRHYGTRAELHVGAQGPHVPLHAGVHHHPSADADHVSCSGNVHRHGPPHVHPAVEEEGKTVQPDGDAPVARAVDHAQGKEVPVVRPAVVLFHDAETDPDRRRTVPHLDQTGVEIDTAHDSRHFLGVRAQDGEQGKEPKDAEDELSHFGDPYRIIGYQGDNISDFGGRRTCGLRNAGEGRWRTPVSPTRPRTFPVPTTVPGRTRILLMWP